MKEYILQKINEALGDSDIAELQKTYFNIFKTELEKAKFIEKDVWRIKDGTARPTKAIYENSGNYTHIVEYNIPKHITYTIKPTVDKTGKEEVFNYDINSQDVLKTVLKDIIDKFEGRE